MSEKSTVFISYSKHDQQFVDQLAKDLRAAGVRVWRDVDDIHPGENWEKMNMHAIQVSDAILHVISEYSAETDWLTEEIQAAHQRGAFVVAAACDEEGREKSGFLYFGIEIVDFIPYYSDYDYDRSLGELIKMLPDNVKQAEPMRIESGTAKGYAFISYAGEDTEFVDHLKEYLAGRGYAYWDYRESPRDYQSQLFLELESVILDAVATLSVISPDWKKSKWAVREFFFSEEARIPIFLLKARDPGPTLPLAGMLYIDFTQDRNAGFQKLDDELKRKGL